MTAIVPHRVLAVLTFFLALAAVSTPPVEAQIRPGVAAPDFTVTDARGERVRLADLKGRIVVLEWTNHECPFVAKHYDSGNMQRMQRDARDRGIVWLTVASTAPGQLGYVSDLEAEELMHSRAAAPRSFILDEEGALARLYSARASLHTVVISADGNVAYMGAIDDAPTANVRDIATARNYVEEAVKALIDNRPVPIASTRAYGCPIKLPAKRS